MILLHGTGHPPIPPCRPETAAGGIRDLSVCDPKTNHELLDRLLEAGYHSLTWRPDGLPSGVYLCRVVGIGIDGGTYEKTVRMQYLR